ncbi:unnamed protein product [Prunus armeniaca]
MAQSVPNFSSMLRKENRKPPSSLPSTLEMDPLAKCWSKVNEVLLNSRGSKSVATRKKRVDGKEELYEYGGIERVCMLDFIHVFMIFHTT